MRGGSLTRYHTPVVTRQEGQGLAEELIKLAGPLIMQQAQAGLQDIQRGKSVAETWATHPRLKTQSPRHGLGGRQTQSPKNL